MVLKMENSIVFLGKLTYILHILCTTYDLTLQALKPDYSVLQNHLNFRRDGFFLSCSPLQDDRNRNFPQGYFVLKSGRDVFWHLCFPPPVLTFVDSDRWAVISFTIDTNHRCWNRNIPKERGEEASWPIRTPSRRDNETSAIYELDPLQRKKEG